MNGVGHMPVLVNEVLAGLDPRPGQTVLDCTAGLGGHASALAQRIGPTGTLILVDLDAGNLAASRQRVESLEAPPRVVALEGSFADAPRRLAGEGLSADLLLADLGFASNQVDAAERGLSFNREGPLDMRMSRSAPITAAELVNSMSDRELFELLRDLGEESPGAARAIASKIVQERSAAPITTTTRLASIVRSVVPRRHGPGSIDPATKTFQALRIAVNDEIGNLRRLLDAIERSAARPGSSFLSPGARVGIIAFHSLEDRPVKRSFAGLVERGLAEGVTRGVVTAGKAEIAANPRSRSAKLRVIRLVGSGVGLGGVGGG